MNSKDQSSFLFLRERNSATRQNRFGNLTGCMSAIVVVSNRPGYTIEWVGIVIGDGGLIVPIATT